MDEEGRFHHVPAFSDGLLAQFFSRELFARLLEEEFISEALVEKISGWRHSGFSVHSKVRAQTRKEAERVGKYMIRPLLSLERARSQFVTPASTPMPTGESAGKQRKGSRSS